MSSIATYYEQGKEFTQAWSHISQHNNPCQRFSPRWRGSFRSGDPFSPRRELNSGHCRIPASSRSGDSVSPKRDYVSLKNKTSHLSGNSSWNPGANPCYSRLGEGHSLGRD